eukprot:5280497-Lingulodinium_polyedra.AAC.1
MYDKGKIHRAREVLCRRLRKFAGNTLVRAHVAGAALPHARLLSYRDSQWRAVAKATGVWRARG